MLLCGRPPPAGAIADGGIDVLGASALDEPTMPPDVPLSHAPLAINWPVGTPVVASESLPLSECECKGISDVSSVIESTPDISPRSRNDKPWPCPGCMGALPCMSGSAKVD